MAGENIYAALETSSKNTRTALLSFLVLVLYVLITLAGITDAELLLPSARLTLPLLAVEVPTLLFAVIAPGFVVVVHAYVLFGIAQHRRLLARWHQTCPGDVIPPFLVNYLDVPSVGAVSRSFIHVTVWSTTFALPVVALVMVQIRLADYQSVQLTAWHFAVVVADCGVLFLFWPRPEQAHGDGATAREDRRPPEIPPLARSLAAHYGS